MVAQLLYAIGVAYFFKKMAEEYDCEEVMTFLGSLTFAAIWPLWMALLLFISEEKLQNLIERMFRASEK
jgi:ABC-type Na+ efflux pump permease subunit